MSRYSADTRISQDGGSLHASISHHWEIWGPNGSYLGAIALRAAGFGAEGHRPSSISIQYLSVASVGHIDITSETVKRGKTAICQNIVLT